MLYQTVKRAIELQMNSVLLGFSADMEKRKVGATSISKVAFVNMKDIFNYKIDEIFMHMEDITDKEYWTVMKFFDDYLAHGRHREGLLLYHEKTW